MEDKLDHISDNNAPWQKVVSQYYDKLKPLVKSAEDNVKKYDMSELTDIPCDKCGKPMLIKKTIKGNFYACSGYPECKNTKPILKEIGIKCPQCEDGQIVERKTRKLKTFYGCSNFPDCTFASWNKPIDRPCPKCGSLLAEGTGKVRYLILCTNKDCDYQEKKTASKTKNEK
jgi:DNA topoisomerase-1